MEQTTTVPAKNKGGRSKIHGHHARGHKTPEYNAWDRMKARCYNPKYENYKWYGAKGITVCDRWLNSFENFLSDVGFRPSKEHSLDRFPNKFGNYEPGNVRWATRKEQARNTTRNRFITYNGETKTVVEWCEVLNLNQYTVRNRLQSNMPIERVFSKNTLQKLKK
jgi:hypothetical protein